MKEILSKIKFHFDTSVINRKLSLMERTSLIISSWFYTGFMNPFPGSWGSLLAIPAIWAIAFFFGWFGITIFIALTFFLGWYSTAYVTEKNLGDGRVKPMLTKDGFKQKVNAHDPDFVVIDEVVGQTIACLPIILFHASIFFYILAFIFFRFFDTLKVYPANYFERKHENAFGVMMDDVVAGIYSAAFLYLVIVI